MKKLSDQEIDQFIESGYVRIDSAFSVEIAEQCRAVLWETTQLDPERPETWTQPVVRIGEIGLAPFRAAANTNVLIQAFNQLAGNNWEPRVSLGTFPIRFPSSKPATDTGWHVDASFPGDNPNNYFDWRINLNSKGRALLMLFLFSDVSENDAPTLIREGSHLDIAKLLQNEGEKGLTFMQLAKKINGLPKRREIIAIGNAGTVYLCHPFIVHAAQEHRGKNPKFMAQPPLLTKAEFDILKPFENCCPVEKGIILGLNS